MIKKILIKMRTSVRFCVLVSVSIFLIIAAFIFLFKPIYKVTLNGEFIGYCENKSKLQREINEYMETGDNNNANIAFAQIDQMPEYEICLLKKGIVTNDEEIFEKVKENSTTYYQYFAILEESEEKLYVSDFATAESVVNGLKEKKSANIQNITISKVYDTQLKDFSTVDTAINTLYVKPVVVAQKAPKYAPTGSVSTARNLSYQKVDIGISLARPISGVISSRFGSNSSVRSGTHTGLDIAAPKGTPIAAAASGTVTFAGDKGAYGNMLVISHGNGVQTYYAHCTTLIAKVGDYVTQGQTIATVGVTGNVTGPHLHLEVRVNGIAYNPANYVYY